MKQQLRRLAALVAELSRGSAVEFMLPPGSQLSVAGDSILEPVSNSKGG